VYLTQMKALLKRHPKTSIIWAHIGLGRIVHPVQVSEESATRNPNQMEIVEAMVTDPAFNHVSFDISWDEVAKYAVATPESIKRVLKVFPGVFTGIGEFSIHKEFVSSKVSGETASLTNPALDRILDFAAEAGLVVILHNDIDMPFAKQNAEPVYLTQMKALLKRHPKTSIIWAHIGLGRIVHPVQVSEESATRNPNQMEIVEAMVTDPAFNHVSFDISWDEVAKYAVATPDSVKRVVTILNKYPDRFLFGSDTVAPAGPGPYFAVFDMWAPVWRQLTPEASLKVRKGNYERIFDEGRRKVRAWERANVH